MSYAVKNTYGVSTVIAPHIASVEKIGEFGGSSLNRKCYPKKVKSFIEELLKKPFGQKEEKVNAPKLRMMSQRTKSKIRKKTIAFSRIAPRLSFLTLTFCNEVEDQKAVKVLGEFLENVNKRTPDFQYIWVAEKQTENLVFQNNIHFHLITNKFWRIKRWWGYWLDLQARHGIVPRDLNFKPTSAFDVKQVQKENIRSLIKYLTGYVTKNESALGCQVWNCSKKISRLYTDFYTGMGFLYELERLAQKGALGGEIKTFSQEFCNVNLIPLNRTTLKFYHPLEEKNLQMWNEKEVENGTK